MGLYFNKRLLFFFIAAIGALVWLAFLSYDNNNRFDDESKRITASKEILYHAEQILSIAKDIETGQRGYAITRDSVFLVPHEKANEEMAIHLQNLKRLAYTSPVHQQRIKQLEQLIAAFNDHTKRSIRAENVNADSLRTIARSYTGKMLLDNIRKLTSGIQHVELSSITYQLAHGKSDMQNFNRSFIGLISLSIVLFLVVFIAINYSLFQRTKAEHSLQQASIEINDLYNNAPCGYLSVNASFQIININQTLLNWLGYTHDETLIGMKYEDLLSDKSKGDLQPSFDGAFLSYSLNQTANNLKQEFKRKDESKFQGVVNSIAVMNADGTFCCSRTTIFDDTERQLADEKILQLNQELESFTYSVSHDLRAPLRVIDGHAQILKEDYNDKLDAGGQFIIDVVINNAKRMGTLIDDLLNFARMGRQEIAKTKVSFNKMVQGIVKELLGDVQKKHYEAQLLDLEPVNADPAMMQQVWTNLISNALKYSSKKEKPMFEIGCYGMDGDICYYVKDNGAGFNMNYSEKLFGVFQRLHTLEEFEGTGVGLALVKRIILRHNGRIWAEGTINEGATFYFTLPNQ